MTKKCNGIIYWTPRILSIIFILFLAMFSLDVIEPGRSAGQIATGLVMHNIPSIVLAIVLIISWKYEIVGGITFLLAGLAYLILVSLRGASWYLVMSWGLIIAGPAFLIGILFLVGWVKKDKN